jgi:Zn-dependent peptidase ImmA (M78 family)
MNIAEADEWAAEIRDRAGVERDAIVGAGALARALGLEIYQSKGLKLPGGAALSTWNGKRYIALASGLDRVRARFLVLHEIAEYVFREKHDERIEHACNAVAAALAMPRGAFARAVRSEGEEPERLAEIFAVTQTAAALRIGEVTDHPLVALSKSFVWVRGREWTWPDEPELRRIMRSGRPGVRVVRLEPRRAALFAEDLDEAA